MTTPQLILSIVYFVVSLALIAIVMLQSGKSAGLSGAIAGGADTFLSKNKAKSWDAKLARWTKWVAIGFMILTLVLCLLPPEQNGRKRTKKGRALPGASFFRCRRANW